MEIDLGGDLTGEASERAFGFRATSSSLKPVHLTHIVFNNTLGHYQDLELLLQFIDRPSKTPSDELDDAVWDKFSYTRRPDEEEFDELRRFMRKVLNNDEALSSNQTWTAPTCTSELLVADPAGSVTAGRFVYTLLHRAGNGLEDKLEHQLKSPNDGISLLFRPLTKDADRETPATKPWTEPELGDAFADNIADEFVDGYTILSSHLQSGNHNGRNYPRDLSRIMKFGSFVFYVYTVNRYNEIRDDGERSTRVPLLLNYTGGRENLVADASIDCASTAHSEIENATRLGVEKRLDEIGARSLDEDDVIEQLESRDLLNLHRNSDKKTEKEYNTFQEMFMVDTADSTFDKLVNTVNNAIHLSQYNTYPPFNTIKTFGWRCGLLKPIGNRPNERWYRPDPEMLEAVVLSVLEPGQDMPLDQFCEKLRTRYGIIVGGTNTDRDHLNEWGISLGSSTDARDPLSNRNYEGFKRTLVDLDYASEYADGVTIISGPQQHT
jgi:hypothetical protein